jgi:integrase
MLNHADEVRRNRVDLRRKSAPGRIRTCPAHPGGKHLDQRKVFCSSIFRHTKAGQRVTASVILGSVGMHTGCRNGAQTMSTRQRRRSWGKLQRMRSGRWQASYTGPDLGRHHAPMTFTARMDGEHWLASERRLIERDEWTSPALRALANVQRGERFGEYATDWLATRNLKPRTAKGYEELLAKPLAPLSTIPLAMLTAQTIRTWHAGMDAATPRRRAHAYGLLHAVLATAVSDGLLATNPAQIRGAQNTPTKRQSIVLTPNEIAKIAIDIRPAQLKAAVLILGWCGLRWGELIALQRRDISADAMVISVSRGVTHRGGECFVSSPKSGRIRTVTVPPHIAADILDHLDHHVGADPDALLFDAPRGCHYSEKTMRDQLSAPLASIGKSGTRIHDMRHTASTLAAKVSTQAALQSRMGHSTPSASARYQHVASGEDAAVALALSALADLME